MTSGKIYRRIVYWVSLSGLSREEARRVNFFSSGNRRREVASHAIEIKLLFGSYLTISTDFKLELLDST